MPLSRRSTVTQTHPRVSKSILSLVTITTTCRPSTLLFEDYHPIPKVPIPETPSHRLESPQERYDVPALGEGKGPKGGGLNQGEGDVPVKHVEARMKGSQLWVQSQSAAGSSSRAGGKMESLGLTKSSSHSH